MPLVDIHVIKGVFSAEQKAAMIARVTDAMVAVEGGNWAIGGQILQAADVRKMAAG